MDSLIWYDLFPWLVAGVIVATIAIVLWLDKRK